MKGHKIMNYKHITINERCCIDNFLDLGWSIRKIAKHLNRNAYTISRNIRRNYINGKYLAHIANETYINLIINLITTFYIKYIVNNILLSYSRTQNIRWFTNFYSTKHKYKSILFWLVDSKYLTSLLS